MRGEESKNRLLAGRTTLRALWPEVARFAGQEDGIIERARLLSLGATPARIGSWLRAGMLVRLHGGVYAVGHGSLTRKGRLRAASMVGPDVGLSHSSAGEWLEIVGPRSGLIHVTCPRRIRRPGLVAHRRPLPPDEIEVVDGALATTLARTILDIAATEGEQACTSALRKAERRRLTDPLGLPALIARYPGARGNAVAKRALESGLYLAMTESWLEDVFLPFLVDRRIPLPLVNATIEVGGRSFRPDCLWPAARLIVELDGRADHELEFGFESDRERDAELLAAGYRVMRITRRQLERDPMGVERRLRAALGIGAALPNLHAP
jgi:hypothetical protein